MSAVRERKRRMVSHSVDVHLDIFKKSGVELILGSGRFIGPRTLEITQTNGTTRRVRGDKVISLEPDIVSVQLDVRQLRLEPGQSVIPHGPDRNLTVGEALPRGKQP